MNLSAIPMKTAKARTLLRGPGFAGGPSQRAWLAMVDGHRSMAQLLPSAQVLGLAPADVQSLAEQELLSFREPRSAHKLQPAVTGRRPPQRSLAAAKLLALDLAARLLGTADAPVRQAAREVRDAPQLMRWLHWSAELIGRRAGRPAADRFVQGLMDALPDDTADGTGRANAPTFRGSAPAAPATAPFHTAAGWDEVWSTEPTP